MRTKVEIAKKTKKYIKQQVAKELGDNGANLVGMDPEQIRLIEDSVYPISAEEPDADLRALAIIDYHLALIESCIQKRLWWRNLQLFREYGAYYFKVVGIPVYLITSVLTAFAVLEWYLITGYEESLVPHLLDVSTEMTADVMTNHFPDETTTFMNVTDPSQSPNISTHASWLMGAVFNAIIGAVAGGALTPALLWCYCGHKIKDLHPKLMDKEELQEVTTLYNKLVELINRCCPQAQKIAAEQYTFADEEAFKTAFQTLLKHVIALRKSFATAAAETPQQSQNCCKWFFARDHKVVVDCVEEGRPNKGQLVHFANFVLTGEEPQPPSYADVMRSTMMPQPSAPPYQPGEEPASKNSFAAI